MESIPTRYIVFFNVAFFSLLLWLFVNFHLPGDTLFWNSLQNSGHTIAFLFATILALKSLSSKNNISVLTYLAILTMLFLLGALIELAQYVSGRGASGGDLLLNGAGIVIGVCYFVVTDIRANAGLGLRTTMVLAAVALSGWVMYKPMHYLISNTFAPKLPILMNFDFLGATAKVRGYNSDVQIATHTGEWPENNSNSAKVTFKPGKWPYLSILEPAGNWQGYEWISFRVLNKNTSDVKLILRVDDHSIDHDDHAFMSISRQIPIGLSTVNISFKELAAEAQERGEAQFDDIKTFLVYIPGNTKTKSLYFDDFRLK